MEFVQQPDTADLWRRLGLDELRRSLQHVEGLIHSFEQIVRTLPPCNGCARLKLIAQIEATSKQLSGEVAGVSALAETLKAAVAVAEHTQTELSANAPEPCQCSAGQCTCHEE